MKGYKGFEKGLACRGKQYAENTVFEEQDAVICESGMHFCENPFDVLDHYKLLNDEAEFNDFAEVEALDDVKTADHKIYCTKKLRIGAKLSFSEFVEACVNFAVEKRTTTINDGNIDGRALAASGDHSELAASGDYSQLASSGDCSALSSSGESSVLSSSGHHSKLAASGSCSQLAASGSCSQLAASGNCSKLAASGYDSDLAASGSYSKLAASGENSIIAGIGINNSAKAKKGCWITLAEWKGINGEYTPVCVKTERVDGEKIKEDTYYKLENGEFVEA